MPTLFSGFHIPFERVATLQCPSCLATRPRSEPFPSQPGYARSVTPPCINGEATALHQRLALHLRLRLTPATTPEPPDLDPEDLASLRDFLHRECAAVATQAQTVPLDPQGFVNWFTDLQVHGSGQSDPLFPWLAKQAESQEMLWFLRQELAGEAGFDDLVALAQVKMPARAKMEMARNLWDEFGRGNPHGVHGVLLSGMAQELGLACAIEDATWEALALANLMAGLAVERYAYQAVGALGVIELTAPGRVARVAEGMARLGMPASSRRYYELHATIDREHSRRWNTEVLWTLVAGDPRTAPLLAQGALMRLRAGERCFARYRREIWGE